MSVNRHPVRAEHKRYDDVSYVYVRDLPAELHGEFLFCPECGGEWSATVGDYFWKNADEPFVCDDCGGEPLRLVKRISHLHVIAGEEIDW